MADIFISYTDSDRSIAEQIGEIIPGFGYTTWYYHRDFVPGPLHLETTKCEIEAASITVVLVSRAAFDSDFVFPEVLHAVSSHKVLLPVLLDVTYHELEKEKPRWITAFGFSTGVPWGNGDSCLVKIIEGCRRVLGDRERPKININAKGPNGDTALIACIRACDPSSKEDVRKRTEIVDMLLSAGADPTITSHDGATAMTLAKEKGLAEMEALLTSRCT